MLSQLQQHLTTINGTDPGHDIHDFLITDRAVAAALGQGSMLSSTEETVLVTEDEDGLALSVYLDSAMLARLDGADPLTSLREEQLSDLWTVLEGISHFNYLAWCAALDRSVTLLELEMQAEVDKFVGSLSLLLAQGDRGMLNLLHHRLFECMHFSEELGEEETERYRAANEYAGRFCHRLSDRLLAGNPDAVAELRRFYRLSQRGKISHIHSCAWSED